MKLVVFARDCQISFNYSLNRDNLTIYICNYFCFDFEMLIILEIIFKELSLKVKGSTFGKMLVFVTFLELLCKVSGIKFCVGNKFIFLLRC